MATPFLHDYTHQKHEAIRRGIQFKLTFDEWLMIWTRSGHLEERGRKRGQFVMARKGDKGPYAVGNVKIITNGDNNREFPRNESYRSKMRKALIGRKITWGDKISKALTGRKFSEAHKQAMRGRKASEETRRRLSRSHLQFSDAFVRKIRREYVFGSRTAGAQALARKYDIGVKTVKGMIDSQRYAHVK